MAGEPWPDLWATGKMCTRRATLRILFSTFRAAKQKDVVSEQGQEAVVALLGTGDFFGENVGRRDAASGGSLRYDGKRDHANTKGKHCPRDP